jgi:hypothetical protein
MRCNAHLDAAVGLIAPTTSALTRRVSPRSLLLFLALLGPVPLLSAQSSLAGVVRDSATGAPIPNAEILINIMNRREVADAEGRFTMFTLPGGRHLVQVRAIGYRAQGFPVNVAARGTTRVEFVLSAEAQELDSVVVTERPSMRGVGAWGYGAFEERRRQRPGIFLDSIFFRRNEALDMRGAMVRGGVPLDRRTGRRVVGRGDCPVAVWVDGVRNTGLELRDFHPGMIQAVEVYRSVAQIPPQFDRLDQRCGVMLIWTRR